MVCMTFLKSRNIVNGGFGRADVLASKGATKVSDPDPAAPHLMRTVKAATTPPVIEPSVF